MMPRRRYSLTPRANEAELGKPEGHDEFWDGAAGAGGGVVGAGGGGAAGITAGVGAGD